ncbi:MAG: TIGR02677 family protein [Burkholderiales bacterium]|nr:TIGR02677 family protein [Burkholderiales bacterium]
MPLPADTPELFRHASAEKAALYRAILEVFAAAKRQYRLQLRPEELLAEAEWNRGSAPSAEELAAALSQLVDWGNLEAQPDMARVTTLADYYRARYLYRLSHGGEAVEAGFERFAEVLARRAELQTVALEDIAHRLQALAGLLEAGSTDVAKLHETLRDLVRVFEGLAENAQAFMAGVARSLELQRADATAVAAYKSRLIDYLERFVGDLVRRSEPLGPSIEGLSARIDPGLLAIAEREARDAAPGDDGRRLDEQGRRWRAWRERWTGLRGWFLATGHQPPQADLLRARARSAIPQLLAAISAINERRSGRSDRSADFRVLAGWFAACDDDAQARRLARAAFALNPARHLASPPEPAELPPSTPWPEAPPLTIHPRLRELGEAAPRGPLARVRVRDAERLRLAVQLEEESRQIEAARRRLATGKPLRLSEIGELDTPGFHLLLGLLGEALAEQSGPEDVVERATSDGLFSIRLQPLPAGSEARIETPHGCFGGRDHWLTISAAS